MALRHLIGVRNPELFAQPFRIGIKSLGLWIKIRHIEARITHADIRKEPGSEDMGPGQHGVHVAECGIARGDAANPVVQIQRNR